MENSMLDFQKQRLKAELPFVPPISLLDKYAKQIKSVTQAITSHLCS